MKLQYVNQFMKRGPYVVINAEAAALIARMTTPPTEARKMLIDAWWTTVKAGGAVPTDAFWMPAAADAQAATLNWLGNTYPLVPTNAPVFTADRGYTGDGVAAYVSTGAIANAMPQFAQDAATIGAWVLNEINTGFPFGVLAADTLRIQARSGGNAGGRLNSATGLSVANTSSVGLTSLSRASGTTARCVRNDTQIISSANVSAALLADEMCLLRSNASYSTAQVACAYVSRDMTNGQIATLYAATRAYLNGLGVP